MDKREEKYQKCKLRFQKDKKIGEGTYAVVYLGHDMINQNRPVAIKKIKMSNDGGLDISAIREVKALRALPRHQNIVELVDCFSSATNLQLVLAYYPYDLEKLIKERHIPFSLGDIKSWLRMIVDGLDHLHGNFFLHRDLKPSNILLGEDGVARIGDFGLARVITVTGVEDAIAVTAMTSQVVTRWYRAPELLFGARDYSGAVDVWAVGCIFAELLLRTPFLPGDSDINQLQLMTKALGSPSVDDVKYFKQLPDYIDLPEQTAPGLSAIFPAVPGDALDLLGRMLTWNPNNRIAVADILKHSFLTNPSPKPTAPHLLPKPGKVPDPAGLIPKRLFT